MLMIRLARFGKKKQPIYRVVVNEKIHPPKSNVVDYIGTYNPKTKEFVYKKDRVEHWLNHGVKYSRTVAMMLVKEGFIKKEDLPALFLVEKKRKKKKEVDESEKDSSSNDQGSSEAQNEEKKDESKDESGEETAVPVEVEEKPADEKKEDAPAKEESKTEEVKEEKKEEVKEEKEEEKK